MMDQPELRQVCERLGIQAHYVDQIGATHHVPEATLTALIAALQRTHTQSGLPPIVHRQGSGPIRAGAPAAGAGLWRIAAGDRVLREGAWERGQELDIPDDLAPGDYRLALESGGGVREQTLIVAPRRAFLPAALRDNGRLWGVGTQLFALRSARNWGIGDFTDLKEFVDCAAAEGAAAIGLTPLHALFPDHPDRCSPYSPSSRLFLNELFIDVEALPEFASCAEARALCDDRDFQAELERLRSLDLVDYAGVSACKHRVLALLHRHFRATQSDNAAFAAFQDSEGANLHLFATFQALSAEFGGPWWRSWPAEYRRPETPETAAFAAAHAERIGYFEWLQFHASRQLKACQDRARQKGMPIGIYLDMAVGVDGDSAEAWWSADYLVDGWSIGAPPDSWNLKGQSWGAPPPNPSRMRETAYAAFRAILAANMRAAGAVRIDHILGLMRLFWVPVPGHPADGAYVLYPFEDLLAIVALESRRHRCLVIGEDLGTVPEGFAETLGEYGILSYRLLYFEREGEQFRPPTDWRAQALAAASTHDLPTLPAFWSGADLELRQRLALYPNPEIGAAERARRDPDRAHLVAALTAEGLPVPPEGRIPVESIYRFLARTPSSILILQPEDLLGITAPMNVPGTVDEYPNWRRKLPVTAAEFFADPEVTNCVATINSEGRDARRVPAPPVIALSATYRLQFNKDFTFADATRLIPYLKQLGVSHLYASPYLKARPGSTHGYDITDHNALNPEVGTQAEFDSMCRALREAGLGQILDFVPNHMGIGQADNSWWLDTLEWGRAAPCAKFFDINWHPRQPGLRDKVMVPMLGDHYGNVLERGELKLGFDQVTGSFSVFYFTHRFPIDPRCYALILGAEDAALPEGEDVFAAARSLKTRLIAQAQDPDALGRIESIVARFNGTAGDAGSFAALHDLLERQHYRLAYWRVAADEINYRRFFDINELAGIRIEDPEVFDATHRLVGQWIRDGRLQGLRLDHIDGLRDPCAYLARLRGLADETQPDFHLLVEKILARHEKLRQDWPIQGTTGYECIALVNGLQVDADGIAELDRTYRRFLDRSADFDEILYACKLQIIDTILASELHRLAGELDAISELHWSTRDYTQERLHAALREVVAAFPVYRTYVSERGVRAEDRRDIAWAISQARKTFTGQDPEILDFVQAALTLDLARRNPAFDRVALLRFVLRFQQYTGPVMAKSLEDTSFYRFNRLLSCNEVGGDPRQPVVSASAFHHLMEERAKTWPLAMTTLSTHDTKRGADLRARLNVLSELAPEWNRRVRRWASLNRYKRGKVDDFPAPSPNDEYAIYQAMVGAWPPELTGKATPSLAEIGDFTSRLRGAVLKSIREAKRRTSWSSPNAAYESACEGFVQRVLEIDRSNPFLDDFVAFQARVARLGVLNSLSQAALALTMPGVPDVYQGSELWDLNLVDPDNRRKVDFRARQDALSKLGEPRHASWRRLLENWRDGQVKLAIVSALLKLRRDQAELFQGGSYEPIAFTGPLAHHLIGFTRRKGERCCVVIAGRLFALLSDRDGRYLRGVQWRDTLAELKAQPTEMTDVLTGRTVATGGAISLEPILNDLPLAVLIA